MLKNSGSHQIQEMIAARVLGVIVPLASVGAIIAVVAASLNPGPRTNLVFDIPVIFFLLLVWGIVYQNKIRLAAHMLTGGLCAAIIVGMALNGGVHAPVYILSIVSIVLIVLLYGARTAFFFTLAIMLTGGVFVYLDTMGLLREAQAVPPWLLWVFISLHCAVILCATVIPHRMLHLALRESEEKHQDAEQALQREKKAIQSLTANQEALQKLNARYEALFDEAGDGVLLLDTRGNIIAANHAFARLHGYSTDEILQHGLPALEAGHKTSWVERMDQVLNQETLTFEALHHHRDGHCIPLSVRARLVSAGDERVIIASHHDLTESKQREAYAALLIKMLDEAPASITVHDADGNFLYANNMTLELHGYASMNEFMAVNLRDLDTPESEALITDRMRRVAEEKEIRFEAAHYRKDGSVLPLSIHAKAIEWQGRPALLSIASDISERKRVEEALAAESAFNKLIIQSAGQGICVCRAIPEFPYVRFTVWNDSMTRITGYTMDEINRSGWYQSVYPDPEVQARAVSRMENVREGDDIEAEEWEITRVNGETRDLLITTRLAESDEGGGYVLAVMSDITERKQAEKEARRAYDFLNNIINTIADPVFVKDEQHRFVMVNDAEVALVGYTREELIGKTDKDFFPETEVKTFWEMDQQVLDTGTHNTNEEPVTDIRTGETRILITRKTRYIDSLGNRYIVGISRDITSRKESERALRISEERFRTAVECVSDFIYERDMSSGEAEFFGELENCLGYAAGTFPTSLTGWLEAIHPDDLAGAFQAMEKASQSDGRFVMEFRIRRADGTYADWLDRGIILRDEHGNPIKTIGSASDITKQKQDEAKHKEMRAQLHQAQKMEAIGMLAGGVAHEFNNLLQVILGLLEMLRVDAAPGSENAQLLNDINLAGNRAAALTQELLAFSRRQTLMPTNLDLKTVIDENLNMLRPLIGANIAVHCNAAKNLGTIRADRSQIDVVLMNLFTNARDAMPDGGTLTIETGNATLDDAFCGRHEQLVPGRYVKLTITDTGHGVDEENINQIFDPFYSTKEVGKGTGLGLATVYGIVTQHKGVIEVFSEIGKGTSFHIYLPVVDALPDEARPAARKTGPGGTETILVAEDNEQMLFYLETILTMAGYNVLAAEDGQKALELFDENADEIDMALLDVIMPKFGGQHVMEHIQKNRPTVKFLFSSGYSADAIQVNFIIKDGLRLIKKPYTSEELLGNVREVLDAPV